MFELKDVLAELGLSTYINDFHAHGFDTWYAILSIRECDFEALGVKLGHRRKLQRKIATVRGFSLDRPLEYLEYTQTDHRHSENAEICRVRTDAVYSDRSQQLKRRYRRRPKPDQNAPEKPATAYVLFANRVRADHQQSDMSFVELRARVERLITKFDIKASWDLNAWKWIHHPREFLEICEIVGDDVNSWVHSMKISRCLEAVDPKTGSNVIQLLLQKMTSTTESKVIEAIPRLREHGVEIDHQDRKGFTALFYASCAGMRRTVETLLEEGANPNLRAYDGISLLDQVSWTLDQASQKKFDRLYASVMSCTRPLIEAGALSDPSPIDMWRLRHPVSFKKMKAQYSQRGQISERKLNSREVQRIPNQPKTTSAAAILAHSPESSSQREGSQLSSTEVTEHQHSGAKQLDSKEYQKLSYYEVQRIVRKPLQQKEVLPTEYSVVSYTQTAIEHDQVQDLIRKCTQELKARSPIPFALLPFRPASNPSAVRQFINSFFASTPSLYALSLEMKLQNLETQVLSGILRWCWSRLPGGVVGWEVYELFRVKELDLKMARDSFSTLMAMFVNSHAHADIIFDFFDLISTLTSQKVSGYRGDKLPRKHTHISAVDFDETFWWVWMASQAEEETAARKEVFGRYVVMQLNYQPKEWVVLEEHLEG